MEDMKKEQLEVLNEAKGYCTNVHEINALARCLLPEIQKFFASPEGQKEFEEWKAQRAKEAEQHKSV